jgi:integrase
VPVRTKEGVTYIEKYNLITTHTARRSGATNMFLAGIPAQSIMKITGHTTESSFMKYLRISKDANATLIANNPFFNK